MSLSRGSDFVNSYGPFTATKGCVQDQRLSSQISTVVGFNKTYTYMAPTLEGHCIIGIERLYER